MKAIKVLMIALVAAFTVNTVSAQTTPAKPAAKTEKPAAKHVKKAHKHGHKKHAAKKVAAVKK
ncbi:hypothetical protein GM921_15755 [Pedobacter sp. LMG 31464]|uniref:Acid-shock protein n=1 Tax=Pedobacter planticolens TaxID=2679964 RepID=A0A923E2Q5_9SPHI|nr:hypothetical protein [Pedobacter planticolens]MBB2146958.1 hypothetical protein [Pedobacter planticolens]